MNRLSDIPRTLVHQLCEKFTTPSLDSYQHPRRLKPSLLCYIHCPHCPFCLCTVQRLRLDPHPRDLDRRCPVSLLANYSCRTLSATTQRVIFLSPERTRPMTARLHKKVAFSVSALTFALLAAGCGTVSAKSPPTTVSATTSTPATVPVTTTTVAKPKADGDSPTSPVPFGQPGTVDGWTVKVVSVTPEAKDTLTGDAAPAGYVFEIDTLQTTRTSSEAESPILLNPVLLAAQAERSVDTDPMCFGGTPYNDQVLKGGTVVTSDCISVPTADVSSLVLGVQGDDFTSSRTWFATKA